MFRVGEVVVLLREQNYKDVSLGEERRGVGDNLTNFAQGINSYKPHKNVQ